MRNGALSLSSEPHRCPRGMPAAATRPGGQGTHLRDGCISGPTWTRRRVHRRIPTRDLSPVPPVGGGHWRDPRRRAGAFSGHPAIPAPRALRMRNGASQAPHFGGAGGAESCRPSWHAFFSGGHITGCETGRCLSFGMSADVPHLRRSATPVHVPFCSPWSRSRCAPMVAPVGRPRAARLVGGKPRPADTTY